MFPKYELDFDQKRKLEKKKSAKGLGHGKVPSAPSERRLVDENSPQLLNTDRHSTAPAQSPSFSSNKRAIVQSRHKRSLSQGHILMSSSKDDVHPQLRMPSVPAPAEYESFTSKRSDFTKPSSSGGSLTSMYTGVTPSARR